MIRFKLKPYQEEALKQLRSGSILNGGVGSGKSLTSLTYYHNNVCGGSLHPYKPMRVKKDLYIITTAMKRDKLEWDKEALQLRISKDPELNPSKAKVVIDSWNNIKKYADVKDAFFIFDEQRLVGSGAWVKAMLKIAKSNKWILLTATPGDTWMDYIPVFIANGFYKNRTEFIDRHVQFDRFAKFPKVKRFLNTERLVYLRKLILVKMDSEYKRTKKKHYIDVNYDKEKYDLVSKKRWNIFEEKPIKNIGELCYVWRKVTNSHDSRVEALYDVLLNEKKLIVFYNFDYELEILRKLTKNLGRTTHEWNGHIHEPVPNNNEWVYLVNYAAGSEGWNCIDTNAIAFFSLNYSYRMMHQASGRTDRMNSPFDILNYYYFISKSPIDKAIQKTLDSKKNFNQSAFVESQ